MGKSLSFFKFALLTKGPNLFTSNIDQYTLANIEYRLKFDKIFKQRKLRQFLKSVKKGVTLKYIRTLVPYYHNTTNEKFDQFTQKMNYDHYQCVLRSMFVNLRYTLYGEQEKIMLILNNDWRFGQIDYRSSSYTRNDNSSVLNDSKNIFKINCVDWYVPKVKGNKHEETKPEESCVVM